MPGAACPNRALCCMERGGGGMGGEQLQCAGQPAWGGLTSSWWMGSFAWVTSLSNRETSSCSLRSGSYTYAIGPS